MASPDSVASVTEVAFSEAGSGPPVVFLHGAGFDRRLWDPQVAYLRDRFHCIAVDLRGHGATVSRDRRPVQEVDGLADDIAALLDRLDIPAAHLVGLSLGGLVAYSLAARHGTRVLSIATLGAPAAMPSGPLNAAAFAVQKWWLYRLLGVPGHAGYRRLQRRWSRQAHVQTYLEQSDGVTSLEAFRPVWEGTIRFDIRALLPSIDCPALVMVGSKDLSHNRRYTKIAADLIPSARYQVVDAAGHILNRDAAETVNAVLDAWLDGHPS